MCIKAKILAREKFGDENDLPGVSRKMLDYMQDRFKHG
jgi:hypothetical protein